MFFKKKKDLLLRNSFLKVEKLRLLKKFLKTTILSTISTPFSSLKVKRLIVSKRLSSNKISKTRIVRRCVLTNRSRSSLRPYNISRIRFRELLQFGIIPGYYKAVW